MKGNDTSLPLISQSNAEKIHLRESVKSAGEICKSFIYIL